MRLPWFRLFDDYFTSPSHAGLTGRDMWIGTVIMSFVRSTCDHLGELQAWALLPTGKPITTAGIAFKARESIADVEASIGALLDTGTFVRREDGAIGMPKFPEKQRGQSTERAAKSKAKKAAPDGRTSDSVHVSPEPASVPRTTVFAPVLTIGSSRTRVDLELLVEKLTYGWDGNPPPTPKGLPRLIAHKKGLEALLAGGMTVAEILTAVREVADLVEAGKLTDFDWTGSKVFSGWLGGMRVQYAKWSREQAQKAAALAPTPEEPSGTLMDFDALGESAANFLKLKNGDPACTS